MKKTRIICLVAAMVFVAAGFSNSLFADDSATIDMLCAAPWEVAGVDINEINRAPANGPPSNAIPRKVAFPWCMVRVFQKDGTFTTHGLKNDSGTWAISGDAIILTFDRDKHTDTILLPLDPNGTMGTDERGNPTHVVQLPFSPPPSPEALQKAADLASAFQKNIVLVSGAQAAGGGFIALLGKSNFVITGAHIVAGINNASFKTLDNTPILAGAASIAVGRDVICAAAPAGGAPLEIMQEVDKNIAAGDEVAVLVNAEGVVKTITGRILGVGPERIEINAELVPGCSGSPVIHLKTGKVIGIAMCVVTESDPVNNVKYAEPITRCYGCRLDNIKGWQAVNWPAFYAQAAEIGKIGVVTSELGIFLNDMALTNGKIKVEQYTSPAIADCFYHWQNDMAGARDQDAQSRANRSLVSGLRSVSQADMAAARQHITCDYFLRQLAAQQKLRDAMADGFKKYMEKFSD